MRRVALVGLFSLASFAAAQVGDVARVHDPVLIKAGKTYYLFNTGDGIPVRTSTDLFNWKRAENVFDTPPDWAKPFNKDKHYWAPDIAFFNGRYHLYYSVSSFGSRKSAIGLMTSPALDKPKWTDRGVVVETNEQSNWNAIDSAICLDEKGTPWMAVGSFWSGLKLFELDKATGKPKHDAKPLPIAARPDADGAIEAPYLIRHEKYYYLFASYDFCCRGINSTYNIRVGRSEKITGPYVDRQSRLMTEGFAEKVLQSDAATPGPGHCSVLQSNVGDFLIHHFYNPADRGLSTLQIRKLIWDTSGWPTAGKPIDRPMNN